MSASHEEHGRAASPFKQPKAVWAVAFACVISFMGIGLVDPILPAIAEGLNASPSQVSLLFTSYFLITALAMLLTGWVSGRIGGKRTLLLGLAALLGIKPVLAGDGLGLLDLALMALFFPLFAWIAFGFTGALIGYALLVSGGSLGYVAPLARRATARGRVAVLMPVHT